MNIIEALNKQKENPKLVISCKNLNKILWPNLLFTNHYRSYELIDTEKEIFSVEEVLSNNWEVE